MAERPTASSGALWEISGRKGIFKSYKTNKTSQHCRLFHNSSFSSFLKSLRFCLIHHPRHSPHSRAFALSRERCVVKLSSLLPKWVSIFLQLAGAGSSHKYAEDSPMSVCTGEIIFRSASLLSAEEIQTAFNTAFPSETVLCSCA